MAAAETSELLPPVVEGIGRLARLAQELDKAAAAQGPSDVQLALVVCQLQLLKHQVVHVAVGDGVVARPDQVPVAACLRDDTKPAQGVSVAHVVLLVLGQEDGQVVRDRVNLDRHAVRYDHLASPVALETHDARPKNRIRLDECLQGVLEGVGVD